MKYAAPLDGPRHCRDSGRQHFRQRDSRARLPTIIAKRFCAKKFTAIMPIKRGIDHHLMLDATLAIVTPFRRRDDSRSTGVMLCYHFISNFAKRLLAKK